MEKEKLSVQIGHIGKSCYVNYFNIFKNYADCNITKRECIDLVLMKKNMNIQELSEKCEIAKDIFNKNMQFEALNLIYKESKDKNLKESIENILGAMAKYS